MKYALRKLVIGCATVAAAAATVAAPPAPLGKEAYEAAEKRIEQQHQADRKACGRMRASARDICEAEADGREKVALARLEAQRQPGPEPERQAKDAKAEADYEVAREKCQLAKGKARDACVQQARDVREAMLRQAKVEKVERINELKAQARQQR